MTALAEPARGDIKQAITDRVVDTVRRVAHASHEARLLETMAEDAIEEGIHTAKRAIRTTQRRVVEDLGDFKDEAVRCVRRQPLAAVGTAFGAGLAIGVVLAWSFRGARVR
jgi:ElaB/YqjD/DUF883 family membrane-anchored ribosome-binding protein